MSKLDLSNLIAWLETQDPRTEYDPTRSETCLMAHWLKSMGRVRQTYNPGCGSFDYLLDGQPVNVERFWPIITDGLFVPQTMCAALERARAAAAKELPQSITTLLDVAPEMEAV